MRDAVVPDEFGAFMPRSAVRIEGAPEAMSFSHAPRSDLPAGRRDEPAVNAERRALLLLLVGASTLRIGGQSAAGEEFVSGPIKIVNARTAPTFPGATIAEIYMSIENTGFRTEQLVGAQTPAADQTSFTRDSPATGVIETALYLEVPARNTLELDARFMHVRLAGLRRRLTAGQRFPLTLMFSETGTVEIEVEVEDP